MAGGMLGALTDLLFRRSRPDDRPPSDKPGNESSAAAAPEKSVDRERLPGNADLDVISGTLAHDLRNPLNTVGLNVHLIRTALARNDQELGALAVDHIERAKQQMVESVDRFRALARASFGEVVREPVDMAALARVLCDRLASAEAAPEVEMVVAELPPTEADPKLARALLWGLLCSALEATRGRPRRRIEVGCESGSEPLTYFVSDDGTDLDRPAGSAEPAIWRRTDGSSQVDPWLDIAVRAVARHGGEVRASSRRGGGVVVRFRLSGPAPHQLGSGATSRTAHSGHGKEN